MPELLISLSPIKSCFVSIPLRYANILWDQQTDPSNVVIEISKPNNRRTTTTATISRNHIYCGWNGGCSQPLREKETLMVDSVWAKQLGLTQEDSVSIKFHSFNPDPSPSNVAHFSAIGKLVFVEPLKADDWEILELNAGYLEDQFLNQAKVVYEGEPLTIWLHNQTFINIKIVSIEPAGEPFVKLAQDSEVIVAPKKRQTTELVKPKVNFEHLSAVKTVVVDTLKELEEGCIGLDTIKFKITHDSIVYLQNLDYDHLFPSPPPEGSAPKPPLEKLKSTFATVTHRDSPCSNVLVHPSLASTITLVQNSKLRIVQVDTSLQVEESIVIIINTQSMTSSALKLTEAVKKCLAQLQPCIIYEGMTIIALEGHGKVKLFFKKDDQTILRNRDALDIIPFKSVKEIHSLEFEIQVSQSITFDSLIPSISEVEPIYGFDQVWGESTSYLEKVCALKSALQLGTPSLGSLLIHGAAGSGKTALVSNISNHMSIAHNLYCVETKCHEWKSLNASKFRDELERIVSRCIWHQPCLLVFEDIDTVLGSGTENDPQSATHAKQFSLLFMDSVWPCLQKYDVVVLCTAKDKAKLNPTLLKSHFFGLSIHLKAPNKAQRIQILQGLIGDTLQDQASLELEDLSGKLEGYSISDLKAVYAQALQKQAIKQMKGEGRGREGPSVTKDDFAQVLETFKPHSLSKSKLQTSSVSWTSIGGLESAKKTLTQTLQWPTKYSRVFASTRLRPRSGLLLYGFPGCGKTMLAHALATEFRLNFISVKGPELLNKYIGQSEASVRDLFTRARAAPPCLLFLDEFDSIAPRRGHDNAGVTDRVVNQFLTEMDGAEGLEGVYVVAATSRPDLVDPALLRPGRLDKAVFCGVPTCAERRDILGKCAGRVGVHPALDWDVVARETWGFTGADLQGLLNSAQLLAINDSIDVDLASLVVADGSCDADGDGTETGGGIDDLVQSVVQVQGHVPVSIMKQHLSGMYPLPLSTSNPSVGSVTVQVVVQASHINQVLASTRPSLQESERNRLEKIYATFAGKGYSPVDNAGTRKLFA